MAIIYTDRISFRAGATPLTFDGEQTIRFNEKASKLVGILLSHSLSTYTTDEGYALAVRLSDNTAFSGKNPVFIMGMSADAGPASNKSVQGTPQDFLALDLIVAPNSTLRVDITTIAGAVQTGTHDVVMTFLYSDGSVPADVLAAYAGNSGVPAAKGGTFGTVTALATTTETALTGNGGTLNIPREAQEIVGIVAVKVVDTAVTGSQELGGHVRFDFGLDKQGKQEFPLTGGVPNLGTEVEGGIPKMTKRCPMYIGNLPATELQTSGFISFLSAITGGADVAINILWR